MKYLPKALWIDSSEQMPIIKGTLLMSPDSKIPYCLFVKKAPSWIGSITGAQ